MNLFIHCFYSVKAFFNRNSRGAEQQNEQKEDQQHQEVEHDEPSWLRS